MTAADQTSWPDAGGLQHMLMIVLEGVLIEYIGLKYLHHVIEKECTRQVQP